MQYQLYREQLLKQAHLFLFQFLNNVLTAMPTANIQIKSSHAAAQIGPTDIDVMAGHAIKLDGWLFVRLLASSGGDDELSVFAGGVELRGEKTRGRQPRLVKRARVVAIYSI
jgi:hypothetical protein